MGIGEAESRGPLGVGEAVELYYARRQLGHITTGRPLSHDFWKCWYATMQLVHVSIPGGRLCQNECDLRMEEGGNVHIKHCMLLFEDPYQASGVETSRGESRFH